MPGSIISPTTTTLSTTSAPPIGGRATCGTGSRWCPRCATARRVPGSMPFSEGSWRTLPPGTSTPMAVITAGRRFRAAMREAHRSACSVWPVPRPDLAARVVALGLAGLVVAAPLAAQACREPHYRWTEKTDTGLASVAPQTTSVSAILTSWAPPDLGPRDPCAPRADRELGAYSVTAWVRRVDRVKDDGDWHVELTERADSPSDSCVVVEIPARQYSQRYVAAPAALDSLIGDRKIRKGGVLSRPVRARVSGAAFFDGQHRRGGRHSDRVDGGHGRCNSSVRALL